MGNINTTSIFCNLIAAPDFTAEQVKKCRQCKHCSSKGNWCGHFGIWIQEKGKIITPKLFVPNQSQKVEAVKPCNDEAIEKDYELVKGRYDGMPAFGNSDRFELVNKELYIKRRQTCRDCPDKNTCSVRGCMRTEFPIKKLAKCPKDKW
jgi:hypothetical protein